MPRSFTRAALVAQDILGIVSRAQRMRPSPHTSEIRAEIVARLEDEFFDIQRMTRNEIRLNDD